MDTTANQTLMIHLNGELVQLNTHQTEQIISIIQAPVPLQNSTIDVKDDDAIHEYILNVNDTFLHSMLGDVKAKAMKQNVDHKLILILLVILFAISYPLAYIWGEDSIAFNVYNIAVYCLLVLPWLIFKHLLFNMVAFKLCIQTFDFWIKFAYGLGGSIALVFLNAARMNGFALLIIQQCIGVVFWVLLISYISSFDAEHSNRTKQLVISVFAALLLSFWTINAQFLLKEEDDTKYIIHLSDGIHVISIQSFLAGAARIVC
eukprot:906280_1